MIVKLRFFELWDIYDLETKPMKATLLLQYQINASYGLLLRYSLGISNQDKQRRVTAKNGKSGPRSSSNSGDKLADHIISTHERVQMPHLAEFPSQMIRKYGQGRNTTTMKC